MPKNARQTKPIQTLNVWRAGMPDFLACGLAQSVHIAGVTGSSPVSPTTFPKKNDTKEQCATVQMNRAHRLRAAFICDHINGVLYSRKTTRQASTDAARSRTQFEGKGFGTHRLIWEYVNGQEVPDGFVVDHIDGNPSNNSAANLRLATWQQNQANAKRRRDNSGGFKGVSLTRSGTYAANISINGRVKYLGAYKTLDEAKAVYLAKAKELRGQFVPEVHRH